MPLRPSAPKKSSFFQCNYNLLYWQSFLYSQYHNKVPFIKGIKSYYFHSLFISFMFDAKNYYQFHTKLSLFYVNPFVTIYLKWTKDLFLKGIYEMLVTKYKTNFLAKHIAATLVYLINVLHVLLFFENF